MNLADISLYAFTKLHKTANCNVMIGFCSNYDYFSHITKFLFAFSVHPKLNNNNNSLIKLKLHES